MNDLDSLEKDLATLNSTDINITTLAKLEADRRLANALPNLIQEIKELKEESKKFRAIIEEALGFECSATPNSPGCHCRSAFGNKLWHIDCWALITPSEVSVDLEDL